MKIEWNGHACFFIQSEEGRILTDPYAEKVPYDLRTTSADVVTVSHDHMDHNAVERITGNPSIVTEIGDFDLLGIPFRGIPAFHDAHGGAERGGNRIYAFTLEGLRLAHLGDIGGPLDDAQREALSDVEILFIPVGGHYTIDAAQAAEIVRNLPNLRIVFPMHYKTDRIPDWPLVPVEEFESLVDNVRRIGASTIEVTRTSLPELREVWILDHA